MKPTTINKNLNKHTIPITSAQEEKSLKEVAGTYTAELAPGCCHTFHGHVGRNYILALTDLDGDYTATVKVWEKDDCDPEIKTVEPLIGKSMYVKMGNNGIRVCNVSNEQSPGRPRILASLYHA